MGVMIPGSAKDWGVSSLDELLTLGGPQFPQTGREAPHPRKGTGCQCTQGVLDIQPTGWILPKMPSRRGACVGLEDGKAWVMSALGARERDHCTGGRGN